MADLETASEASSLKNKTWDVGQKAQRSSSYISEFVVCLFTAKHTRLANCYVKPLVTLRTITINIKFFFSKP